MTFTLPAQVGLACLILAQTLLTFAKPVGERDEKPRPSLKPLFGKTEEASADEEYARLARKAQCFWQGGLTLGDWPAARR